MSDVLAVRDEYRAQMWIEIIRDCKASGMSNKDFCLQRGVSEKCFYYWQRKLREQVIEELKAVAFAPASDASGAELKVAQKLRALELLGKHMGLFEGLGARVMPKVEIREDV